MTAATPMKEIETLPDESVAAAFDFVVFLKSRTAKIPASRRISIKDARGIFRDLQGMDTSIEREEGEVTP